MDSAAKESLLKELSSLLLEINYDMGCTRGRRVVDSRPPCSTYWMDSVDNLLTQMRIYATLQLRESFDMKKNSGGCKTSVVDAQRRSEFLALRF